VKANVTTLLHCGLLSIITLLAPGCKKDDDGGTPDGPACSAADSWLSSRRTLTSTSDTTVRLNEDGLPSNFRAVGRDTVIEDVSNSQIYYYIFNALGDHVQTRQVHAANNPAMVYNVDFFYAYDTDHRLLRRWSYMMRENARLLDSVELIWDAGNMIAERDLLSGETLSTYTYTTDGKGRNPGNTPSQSSRWLYRRGSNVTLSKDYLSTGSDGSYNPHYDKQGRLTELAITGSATVGKISKTYSYQCR
jgi:hypothetical protein